MFCCNTYVEVHSYVFYCFFFSIILELEMGTQCIVEVKGRQTVLHHPLTSDKTDR